MFFLKVLTAVFIGYIWLRYFRDIDIFEREKWLPMLVSFLFGGLSVGLLLLLNHFFFSKINFRLQDIWWNDILFIIFKNAGPEETVKVLAFALTYWIFKKEFREPLDFLIYCSLGALGFSVVENILYFQNHGVHLIVGRGILSTVGHMFDTALFAYGIILFQFKYQRRRFWLLPLFFVLAVLSHTMYNFPLLTSFFGSLGYLVTIGFWLLTISAYATILNNAINQSPFFIKAKVINQAAVWRHLLISYGLLFILQTVLHILDGGNFVEGLFMLLSELFSFGAVIFMSSLRLSRFQLIKGRWFPVKMEFPFEYSSVIAPGLKNASSSSLKVRGPNYNAQIMHSFYGLVANLRPIRTDKSKFPGKVKSQIVDKVFLQENFPVYKTKIWLTESDDFQYYALFPKLHGSKLIGDSQSPVIGLAIWREAYDNESEAPMPASALDIMEWFAMTEIKPKEKQVQ